MDNSETYKNIAEHIVNLETSDVNLIAEVIDLYLNSPYCPTCGSCGETGCCSPDMCETVKCHYGESNLASYKELEKDWNEFYTTLKQIQEIDKGEAGKLAEKALASI